MTVAEHDLVDAALQGKITARARGGGLSQVVADLANNTKDKLRLLIPTGTVFQSSGGHQSMAVRQPTRVDLDPEERRVVTVGASCVNAERPVPKSIDEFNGVERAPKEVVQFMELAHDQDRWVMQVGVWALTNDLTGQQCRDLVRQEDQFGRPHGVVTDKHIQVAADLLNRLGLSHRLQVD